MKILLAFLITLSALKGYSQTNVQINVKGFGNKAIIAYWQDFTYHQDTISLDENGHGQLNYRFSKPSHIRLKTIDPDSSSPFLFVLDGETITMNKNYEGLKIQGSLEEYNNFLIQTDSAFKAEFRGKSPDYNAATNFVLNRSATFFKTFKHPQRTMVEEVYTLMALTDYKLYPVLVKYSGDSTKISQIADLFKSTVKAISPPDDLLKYLDRINFSRPGIAFSNAPEIMMMNNYVRILRMQAIKHDSTLNELDEYIIEKNIINDLMEESIYRSTLQAYNLHFRINDYTKYPMQLAGIDGFLTDFERENPKYKRLSALKQLYSRQLITLGSLTKGANAPSFRLPDTKGKLISLSDFKGKVVYLDFWASWCGPCLKEMPYIKTMEQKFEGQDVQFIAISIDTRTDSWIKKIAALKMGGIQLIESKGGTDSKIAQDYKIHGVPHYILIDKNGKIASSFATRPSLTEDLEKEINSLLK